MATPVRQPAIFLPHGGGPCFWMTPPPPFSPHAFDGLKAHLASLLDTLPARPKAILIVSGHWEEMQPTVSTSAAPPMLFDYYGFPKHAYQLNYPAPGSPDVAQKVRSLMSAKGIAVATDTIRGFDHGVFVPLLIVDPKAEIPVVMLSLQQDLDPAFHIAIGEAIAPLRDEGVLIIGSGMSYHDLSSFFDGQTAASAAFDGWLEETIEGVSHERRNARLKNWTSAPNARDCHPREDHLMPLMVISGAAIGDVGRRVFHDTLGGKLISGFAFG